MSYYYHWAHLFLIFYCYEQHCIEETYGWIYVLLCVYLFIFDIILWGKIPRNRLSGSKNIGFWNLLPNCFLEILYKFSLTPEVYDFSKTSLCWDFFFFFGDNLLTIFVFHSFYFIKLQDFQIGIPNTLFYFCGRGEKPGRFEWHVSCWPTDTFSVLLPCICFYLKGHSLCFQDNK